MSLSPRWLGAAVAVTVLCAACVSAGGTASGGVITALDFGAYGKVTQDWARTCKTVGEPGASVGSSVDPDPNSGDRLGMVYDSLVDRMKNVSADSIRNGLEGAASKHGVSEEELAGLVLLGSAWGRLDKTVYRHLVDTLYAENMMLWYSGVHGGMLSDTLLYLFRKLGSDAGMFTSDMEYEGPKRVAVLVDDVFLRMLEDDVDFREAVQDAVRTTGNVVFVHLSGYYSGINLVNHADHADVIDALGKELSDSKSLPAGAIRRLGSILGKRPSRADVYSNLSTVLAAPLKRRLKDQIVLNNELLAIETPFQAAWASDEREWAPDLGAVSAEIAALISPRAPTRDDFISAISDPIRDCDGAAEVASVLEDSGYIFSKRSVGAKVKYLIPKHGKSFSMAAYLFLMANRHVSPADVIMLSALNRVDLSYLDALVILDDYAGSGDSLLEERNKVERRLHRERPLPVVMAPLVASHGARVAFDHLRKGLRRGDIVAEWAVPVNQPLKKRPWMGYPGYKEGYFFLAFPYMSVDNNASLMAKYIAPLFVWSTRAVKILADHDPICTPWGAVDAVTKECAGISTSLRHSCVQPQCLLFAVRAACHYAPTYMDSGRFEQLPGAVRLAQAKYGHGAPPENIGVTPQCVRDAVAQLVVAGAVISPTSSYKFTTRGSVCEELYMAEASDDDDVSWCALLSRYMDLTEAQPALTGYRIAPAEEGKAWYNPTAWW